MIFACLYGSLFFWNYSHIFCYCQAVLKIFWIDFAVIHTLANAICQILELSLRHSIEAVDQNFQFSSKFFSKKWKTFQYKFSLQISSLWTKTSVRHALLLLADLFKIFPVQLGEKHLACSGAKILFFGKLVDLKKSVRCAPVSFWNFLTSVK